MTSEERRQRLLSLIREHSFREGDFLLSSGRRSRFYVDLRRTSLTAEGAYLIGEILLDTLDRAGWSFAAAGGMTLGADPLTTAVGIAAHRRKRPLSSFIVRKEPKGHGAEGQIEAAGDLEHGARVVVLDDTVTTGGSTLRAAETMRAAGYDVVGAACVIDRSEGGTERLSESGIELLRLFSMSDLSGDLRP